MSPVWQNDSGSIGTKTSVSDSRKGVRKEGQRRIWRKRKKNNGNDNEAYQEWTTVSGTKATMTNVSGMDVREKRTMEKGQ